MDRIPEDSWFDSRAEAVDFSFLQSVLTGSEAHLAFYPMDSGRAAP